MNELIILAMVLVIISQILLINNNSTPKVYDKSFRNLVTREFDVYNDRRPIYWPKRKMQGMPITKETPL